MIDQPRMALDLQETVKANLARIDELLAEAIKISDGTRDAVQHHARFLGLDNQVWMESYDVVQQTRQIADWMRAVRVLMVPMRESTQSIKSYYLWLETSREARRQADYNDFAWEGS